jgi:N6-adenosine-specific RNA methylase IME4
MKFGCVYADPPWEYDRQPRGAAARHYPTMTLGEILALPVSDLVADDAHLHLWATHSFLFEARRVLEAWGFAYRSQFVWVKPQLGCGYYWRSAAEYLLLGVRGRCRFRDRSVKNWLLADRTTHSTKPEAVRRLVERVSPPPYLELFGRRVTPGWAVFGNETERTLFDPPGRGTP